MTRLQIACMTSAEQRARLAEILSSEPRMSHLYPLWLNLEILEHRTCR